MSKNFLLSELEELVLLSTAVLFDDGAYGYSVTQEILQRTGKKVSMSAVHTVLYRLQDRGLVKSELGGASQNRGGRRKRLFKISQAGKAMVTSIKKQRDSYWDEIGDFSLGYSLKLA